MDRVVVVARDDDVVLIARGIVVVRNRQGLALVKHRATQLHRARRCVEIVGVGGRPSTMALGEVRKG